MAKKSTKKLVKLVCKGLRALCLHELEQNDIILVDDSEMSDDNGF